ncbi:MAG: phosphoglycerate kinase [Halobacteriaceae archaeon]
MDVPTMDEVSAAGRTVAVRVDVNSPLGADGGLADDARVRAHVDTIAELCDRGAAVAILAHQGRPGGDDFERLRPHATRFDELIDADVGYCEATFGRPARETIGDLEGGAAVVLENTRFYSEEYMEFDPAGAAETHLVSDLVGVLDAYVNDAFAAAHRSQPSLVGFPHVVPAYAGRVMERELAVLGDIASTARPRVYVFGGAKVADALSTMHHVLERDLADTVLTAGLVGNLFLDEDGVDLGEASRALLRERVAEPSRQTAREILETYRDRVVLPSDVAVDRGGARVELDVVELPTDEAAQDVGEATIAEYESILADAGTAVLNGPAGVFEQGPTALGTKRLFAAVAAADYSVVGGGDSAAAIRRFGIEGFDHVSTGGGAALRLLSDASLPAVEALR